MKMKRIIAMIILLACLFNAIIVGYCEQQSSSPIIQAVVPYLDSCMNFDDIEKYELNTSRDVWDRNKCIVIFDLTDGNKNIGIIDLYNRKFFLYLHTPSEERDYGLFFNEEIVEIFYHSIIIMVKKNHEIGYIPAVITNFNEIQEKLTSDIKLIYQLKVGDDDYCVITSENVGRFL